MSWRGDISEKEILCKARPKIETFSTTFFQKVEILKADIRKILKFLKNKLHHENRYTKSNYAAKIGIMPIRQSFFFIFYNSELNHVRVLGIFVTMIPENSF